METYNPRNNNNNNRNFNNNNYNRNFNNNNNGGDRGGNGNSRNNNNGNFRNNNNGNNNNFNKGGGNFNNSYGGGENRVKTYPSELPIATNYFRFAHLNQRRNCYYKYSVEIENLPEDSKKMRTCVYRSARALIAEKLGKTIFNNTLLYSKTLVADAAELQFSTKFRDSEYKIALKYTNTVENESFEALALYKRYFNTLISQIDFIDMKGSYFDARNACVMNDYNLDIWSGFAPTVSQLKNGILLNLNVTHKVIRYETALDLIMQLQNNHNNKNDFAREVQAQIQNLSVITRYNGETNFTIDSICLDKSPRDVFEVKVRKGSGPLKKKENRKLQLANKENDPHSTNNENNAKSASGSKTLPELEVRNYSYVDYYWEKYGKKINPDQPLLKVINKRRDNQEIFLVPELCYLTGLTENMRSNFNMMKDMNAKTKGNPAEKLKETQDLIQKILSTPGGKKAIQDWEITLEPEVMRLKGVKINTGNVLMAQQKDGSNTRLKIDIDATPDLDRKIQNEMYSQPQLNNWIVS
jgi:aubergine